MFVDSSASIALESDHHYCSAASQSPRQLGGRDINGSVGGGGRWYGSGGNGAEREDPQPLCRAFQWYTEDPVSTATKRLPQDPILP